jgi:hypothetical protein
MFITKMALPRRTFLRGMGVGMGVTLALPLLDAMVPALSAMAKTAAKPTPRLGFFYVPNGCIMESWLPKGEGTTFEMSPTLAALTPYRDQLIVLDGLANHEASKGTGAGLHAKAQTAFLSGVFLKETEGADFYAGTTLDQIAADKLSQDTPLRSLELGTEPGFLASVCEQGISCVYQNTMAWRNPTTPLPVENNPRVVFERLFGEGGTLSDRLLQAKKDRSILDWVNADVSSLQQQLGASDRTTVDEYLSALRDVEQRIQQQEKQSDASTLAVGEMPIGIPESQDDHTKLLLDLQFLAYQADITRIVTYMVRREESQATYPQIGVPDAHHWCSHHGGNPDKIAMVAKINAHHVSLFSHLVERMKKTPDGDGTLLDHAIFMYGAGFGDGNVHSPERLPIMVVGGGCGTLKGGRVVKYQERTPLMNLGSTLLEKIGVPADKIGDSTGRLTDL